MLTNDILSVLYQAADQEQALDEILGMAGREFKASRSYIFELDSARQLYDNTYEWCLEGVEPQKANLRAVPRDYLLVWEGLFKSSEVVRCSDIEELDALTAENLRAQSIKSILVAPLCYKNDYIGFMGFDECLRHRQWTDDEVQTLRNMASIVSTAVTAIRRERERARLFEVSRNVLDSLSSAVYVADAKTHQILLSNRVFKEKLPSLAGTACFYVNGSLHMPEFCPMEEVIYSSQAQTPCPDRKGDAPACDENGCVRIVHSETSGDWYKLFIKPITWLDGSNALLGNFLDITDVKTAEEEVIRLASLDGMTGVLNRNIGLKKLLSAVKRCREQGRIFSLAYIDIDNLKPVNDKYGHNEGDYMITAVADALKKAIREGDMICRLGGDEFLALLNDCGQNEILSIMVKVESGLKQTARSDGKPYRIGFSYGAYSDDAMSTLSLKEMIQICDKRMYSHKRSKGERRRKAV